MQTGWKKIRKYYYHFDKKGLIDTGRKIIDGKTYQFSADGRYRGRKEDLPMGTD